MFTVKLDQLKNI